MVGTAVFTASKKASGFNHQGVLINWGPERTVEIKREKDETKFGLSIFGKHICNSTYGIFIGNVNSHSPAGRTGQLFAGDKINQIGNQAIDSDIKVAHDALDNAGDTIQLIVQSVQKVMESENSEKLSNNTENQQKSKFNLKYVVYGALSMMTYLFFGNYFLLLGSFHSDVGGTETITPNGTNETIVIERNETVKGGTTSAWLNNPVCLWLIVCFILFYPIGLVLCILHGLKIVFKRNFAGGSWIMFGAWNLTFTIMAFNNNAWFDRSFINSDEFENSFPNKACGVMLAPGSADLCMTDNARKGKYGAQIAETLVVTLGYGLILLLLHIIAIIIQKCQKTKDRMPNYSKV